MIKMIKITALALSLMAVAPIVAPNLVLDTRDIELANPANIVKVDISTEKLATDMSSASNIPVYIREVVLTDGGTGYTIATAPGFVRRPVGVPVNQCQRKIKNPLNQDVTINQGDLTRFPIAEAVGAGCVPVACSVYGGENAEATEISRIQEENAR